MRIFMTGATGYIGSVVAEKAVAQGHTVVGLARSEASLEKLKKMGVTPVAGDLESLNVLTRAASESDAVLHLGFVHEFHRPYDELLAIDMAAIRALGKGIAGTGKRLLMTSGTGVTEPDVNGAETDEESPITNTPLKARVEAEQAALALESEGVSPVVLRLAPYVYGRGGSVFVPALLKAAAEHGVAPYVGDGMAHFVRGCRRGCGVVFAGGGKGSCGLDLQRHDGDEHSAAQTGGGDWKSCGRPGEERFAGRGAGNRGALYRYVYGDPKSRLQ